MKSVQASRDGQDRKDHSLYQTSEFHSKGTSCRELGDQTVRKYFIKLHCFVALFTAFKRKACVPFGSGGFERFVVLLLKLLFKHGCLFDMLVPVHVIVTTEHVA